eukprot:1430797-Pleurochrysis_carterae.AAC.1
MPSPSLLRHCSARTKPCPETHGPPEARLHPAVRLPHSSRYRSVVRDKGCVLGMRCAGARACKVAF